ncbi:tetratricopeptide repeat protein, partial [Arthrospira platensis]
NKLLQQGKIQEAVAEYRRGIELTPDLSWHHYYLGEALTQLEDWEGAVQAYRQAISLGSNYLCYYRLGVALVKLELWDEAIATLNQGLELKPDYYKFYLPLGQALVHQQHWEAAIEAYGKAVALKPGVAEFNLQLGHLLRRQGRFTEAVGYLQQAADFQGDDPQLQLGLGVALVEAGTDLHRAEASLRRTLELQPDQGEAYFYLGKLEGLRGRWHEALAMYRRSWEINPHVGEWGLALAEALEKLGRWSEAVDQYRQVVLELGESGEASLGLGRALVQLERPVEAVVELRRAVKLGVDRPEVHRLWAGVLVELGRWPDVVEQWQWLLERYPGAADIRRRLALALMGLGRWPEAAAQWGEYWRVAPGSGRGSVVDFRPELGTYGEIDHRQELSITGDLTVEFWLYLRRWPESWTEIISKFVSDEQNEFCFRLKDGQRAQWYFGKGEAFAKPVDWVPQEDMRLHEWVHVACVRKVGEYGRIYFDGVLRREADWSGEPEAVGTEATVRLMAHSDGKRFNDGKLSELRIWNRARSADEIRQGMYEALTGDEPGLVGVWHGSDDGVLVDAVGHHQGRSVMADAGKERLRVGVCGWELSHNAAGRAYTLAQLYGGWAEVELIGCLFPRYGGQVWEPIRGTQIPCHTVTVADEGRFVEQALGLVLAHPYEVVHLSKPRIPNIVLGLLYKLVWGARVIVDIDDEELAFVKASEPVNWRELPPLRDLDSQEWTEIAAGLAQEFDKVRELDGAEAGEAEAGKLLEAVVAEVLAVPGGGVSQGLDLLLQGLPAVESVKSALGDKGKIEQVRANDGLSDYFAYHRLGEALEELGRFDEAIEAYRRSVELQPEAAWSYLNLSRVLWQVGQVEKAEKARDQAVKIKPELAELTQNWKQFLGEWQSVSYHSSKLEEKTADLNNRYSVVEKYSINGSSNYQINQKFPSKGLRDDPWLRPHQVATELKAERKIEQAIEAYCNAIALNPGYPNSYYELAKLLQQQGKLDEAIANYQEATDLAPRSSLFHRGLAQALSANQNFDEAIASYRTSLVLSSEIPEETYKDLASTLLRRSESDVSEAVDLYVKIILQNPQDLESFNCIEKIALKKTKPYLNLAKYLIQENYIDSAIRICEIAINLKLGNTEIYKLHNLALTRKFKLEHELNFKNHYHKLHQFPQQVEVYLELGKALVEQGEIDKAIVFYQMGLQIKPSYAEICFELGNALKLQYNLIQAVEWYKKAAEIDSNYCWYYNSLGDALKNMGHFNEAISAYSTALKLKPEFDGFYKNVEKALNQQKRLNEIKEFCQNFSKKSKSKIKSGKSLKILMVTSYPPYPPNSGAPMRMFEEIKYLASRHDLIVVSFIFSEKDYKIEQELTDYCDLAVMIMLDSPYAPRKPNEPRQVHRWHTWNMRTTLEVMKNNIDFDIVLFDFIYMASYVDLFQDTYTVLEEHNIESDLLQQCAHASPGNYQLQKVAGDVEAAKAFLEADKEALLLQEYETRTWTKFNLVTLVSEVDMKQVQQRCPRVQTLIVENGTDTDSITPVDNSQGRKILFMGNLAYYPNIDGVLFFVEEILPKIWEQDPTMTVSIAGRDPGVQIQKLAQDPRIEIVASPKDMSQVAKDCMMTVVPLRLGSGTRLKILHSMAMGLPVVSTNLGCEGLSGEDGTHILIRDEPQKFADAVVDMSRDPNLRHKLRLHGLELVKSKYTWNKIFSRLEKKLLNKVLG